MEIKDLAGLSKPLTKLIEVVSQGVGNLSEPYLIRKKADAKAYEIKAIAHAVKENQNDLKEIDYSEEKVSLSSLDLDLVKEDLTLEERTNIRINHKEQKKQKNIENITQNTAKFLEAETNVSDEPVDEDWITRFFNYAEDVSDEKMQTLWGQVLAGEIKQPNSYSLRTLELLRNLTKKEAQILTKAANLVIEFSGEPFLYDQTDILEKHGISFDDQILLIETGLLSSKANLVLIFKNDDKDVTNYFLYNKYIIRKIKKANTTEYQLPALRFTKIGTELLKLISKNQNNDYIKEFCQSIDKNSNIDIHHAFILSKNGRESCTHTKPWLKF
jgi:uncharacterized protein DUF2806